MTLVSAGRVGKPHGLDGSFYVDGPRHDLAVGTQIEVAGALHAVERRAGTDRKPLIRLAGVDDPRALRGETMLVDEQLEADEWLASDLIGCTVQPRLGRVERVVDAPTCSVLELDDGTLVPLVSDAIESVDLDAREIRVREGFLR